jgi:hypothetical protein
MVAPSSSMDDFVISSLLAAWTMSAKWAIGARCVRYSTYTPRELAYRKTHEFRRHPFPCCVPQLNPNGCGGIAVYSSHFF